jgi:pimeloyl-ACP methyl ester carboxylesterase
LFISGVLLISACQPPRIRQRPFPAHSLGRSTDLKGLPGRHVPAPVDLADFSWLASEAEGPKGASPGHLLALADFADREGHRQIRNDPIAAMSWFRDASCYASFALTTVDDPEMRARAIARHNEAVEQLLRCAGTGPRRVDPDWRGLLASAGVQLASTNPTRAGLPCQELWITRDFRVRNLDLVGQDGIGVPLVTLSYLRDRDAIPDRFLPERLKLPATAVLRPTGTLQGGAWRRQPVWLTLHDPASEAQVVPALGSPSIPLAADLTTPIAHQILESPLDLLTTGGLLRPDDLESVPGIFMQAPYQPGKIPVLFVHGLWSSPSAWLVMANHLQADPMIRARYQFWFAYYPTGAPLASSASRIRRELADLRLAIDPMNMDPSLDQMVVVGHSLGGVLSRQLLQDSDRKLEQALFTRPIEQVAMSPETRNALSQLLNFRPVPSVRRAVFIAAPHRGSNVANGLLGRVTTLLVRRTGQVEAYQDEIIELNGREVFAPTYRRRPPSSIDNLERGSPILQVLSELPTAPGVPYHSIIGTLMPEAPVDRWTDGIVPYDSAQLDGAESELVIRHNHFATEAPETVDEVHRILRLHLGASLPPADPAQ